MKRAELITALKKAKAKKQVIGLKTSMGDIVGRILHLSDSTVCLGTCKGATQSCEYARDITHFWTYKPSSRRQVRQRCGPARRSDNPITRGALILKLKIAHERGSVVEVKSADISSRGLVAPMAGREDCTYVGGVAWYIDKITHFRVLERPHWQEVR
jgi:hypothetical protein